MIAHIKQNSGDFEIQTLADHLFGTAKLAESFADEFKNPYWGWVLGSYHDLGKFSKDFQEYIKINSGYEEDDQKKPKTDHTSAGAILIKETLPNFFWQPLAYCIAGHHAGLHNWLPEIGVSGDLTARLRKQEFLEAVRSEIPSNPIEISKFNSPTGKPLPPDQIHLWIRMLFSCLVDADYLDTERFMNPVSYSLLGKYKGIEALRLLLDDHIVKLSKSAPTSHVNDIRNEILKNCVCNGELEPGFFSINVPTGGGKTLSSMAWALEHAVKYNKKRIVFAIPYTSIITQTAQVYRNILGEDNVIEHHSNIDELALSQERKLATENWDAPVIVTTNVQLFESLFANRSSRCRKLHNLANSIIILDEAQMLPPDFLNPILSVLNGLVKNFGVTVLFSTATQPVLTGRIGGSGINSFKIIEAESVREIVPNFQELAYELKRVKVQMPQDTNVPTEWEEIANELQKEKQVLCIVNTRKDCRELFNLMPEGTIHLSRMMCSAHIMDCISEIKQLLAKGESIHVVSTQLIEAGVDIDFPVVYRALAGLDSIAQSAGRCNREGKLNEQGKLGLTKVFCSINGIPPGFIRSGANALVELSVLYKEQDFLEPDMFQKYFNLFYSKVNDFDKPRIENLLVQDAQQMKFQFATAARDFRLIDDKGAQSILVDYKQGADLMAILKRKGPEPWLMRKLQRYSVSVNVRDFEEIKDAGLIEEVHGCWIQTYEKLYNSKAGIMSNGKWLEEIHII